MKKASIKIESVIQFKTALLKRLMLFSLFLMILAPLKTIFGETIWIIDHEDGDLSDWQIVADESFFNIGGAAGALFRL